MQSQLGDRLSSYPPWWAWDPSLGKICESSSTAMAMDGVEGSVKIMGGLGEPVHRRGHGPFLRVHLHYGVKWWEDAFLGSTMATWEKAEGHCPPHLCGLHAQELGGAGCFEGQRLGAQDQPVYQSHVRPHY